MIDSKLQDLYARIETALDNLEEGKVKNFEAPHFTASELMTIPDIVKDLQDKKYNGTIKFERKSLRTIVTKLKKEVPVEISVFENLVFEKSEEEEKAQQAYDLCLAGNHELIETKKTTFKNPLLVCKQCKLGYTFKMKSGTKEVANVTRVTI